MADSPLHPSIVAMVSLAANIAANHPKNGLCQLERLRGFGIAEEQIDMVVDIARHIRDEAGRMQDHAFNEAAKLAVAPVAVAPREAESGVRKAKPAPARCVPSGTIATEALKAACCTPTAKGNSCC
jgi:hypothetical protein